MAAQPSNVQIMTEMLRALERDWAGMPECDDGMGARWLQTAKQADRRKQLNDRLLCRYMTQRVAGLGDAGVCFVAGPEARFTPQTCGFVAQAYNGELWVTKEGLDGRLRKGDRIVSVNKATPAEYLASLIGNPCGTTDPERQVWDPALVLSSHLLVVRPDGSQAKLSTQLFPTIETPRPACSLTSPAPGTFVLTVTHFDTDEAARLLTSCTPSVSSADRLVIDVRGCSGGIESMAYPLLDYLFDEDTNLRDVLGDETVLTNYTPENCARREAQIAQLRLLAQSDASDSSAQALDWMDENLAVIERNRGKGYVEETATPEDLPISAAPASLKVTVLTDRATSDAAEWFARVARTSPRATVVGRATAGGLDYSNPVSLTFGTRYMLVYPMSKTKAAAEGRGLHGVGVVPHVVVPFTPDECFCDVVLQNALAL